MANDSNSLSGCTENTNLCIATLNVRGIREKYKRFSISQWFTSLNIDILFLQETFCTDEFKEQFKYEWLSSAQDIIHSCSDSNHSKGVTIVFKKGLNINIEKSITSDDGRRLLINCKINGQNFSLVNIYAPNKVTERIQFFKRTSKWIRQNITEDSALIIAGDFNSVMESRDRTTGRVESCHGHFKNLLKQNSVIDVYRNKNPDQDGFTWTNPANPSHKSRLDYILMSGYLNQYTKECTVKNAPTPDHSAVVCCLKIIHKERGPGYWKLNTSILNDKEYQHGIKHTIQKTKDEYSNILTSGHLWDLCKIRIKEYSIKYCVAKAKQKRNLYNQLDSHINEIDAEIMISNDNIEFLVNERAEVKRKMEILMIDKAKGHQIRSRAKWIEDGEKSTAYFARLEKQRQTYNNISKLKTDDDDVVEDDVSILKEATNFYKRLYKSSNPKSQDVEQYVTQTLNMKVLNDEDRDKCEGQIQKKECEMVMKHMKKNKSPGLDGIPLEFYQTFWDIINDILLDVYNESFITGELPYSQRTSVLSLIFKKGDRLLLKNFRPISLATTDYKIMAFVLANRLQKVLDKIISTSQAGYVKKRFIGCNIRLIEDLLDYSDNLNDEASIIFLDFQKAFDTIEWVFIHEALKKFNFGPQFIHWIKTIYTNPGAKIKNNGWLSDTFEISRGIRQGCPVSALLFIIAVEVLALNLKNDNTIQGIKIVSNHGEKEVKVMQYADDTVLLLNDHISINNAILNVIKFSKVSGLVLNVDKSEAISIRRNAPILDNRIKWVESAKCLGIYVGHNKDFNMHMNWQKKIDGLRNVLEMWKKRDLSIYGKINVIKMLAVPKLTFSAQNTSVPKHVVSNISRILFEFIWGRTDRIRRNIMIGPKEWGGMAMMDIESHFEAIKASWIKHYDGMDNDWAILMKHYINSFGMNNLILHMTFQHIETFPALQKLPPFYRDTISSFNKSKDPKKPTTHDTLVSNIIWGNRFIMIKDNTKRKNVTLYFKDWIEVGIIRISDLLILNGEIQQQYVHRKLIRKANFLSEMFKVKTALKPFKNMIGTNMPNDVIYTLPLHPNFQNDKEVIDVSQKRSKFYYEMLIKKKCEPPNLMHWTNILDRNYVIPNIEVIMECKVLNIKENKLAEFNYKFLCGITACGVLLNKWKPEISKSCKFCGQNDTQYHIIYHCPLVTAIWQCVSDKINRNITLPDIAFGIRGDRDLNNLISQIAYSIHKYWIIHTNDHQIASKKDLKYLLFHDLMFKSKVLTTLKEDEMSNLFLSCSRWLHENMHIQND